MAAGMAADRGRLGGVVPEREAALWQKHSPSGAADSFLRAEFCDAAGMPDLTSVSSRHKPDSRSHLRSYRTAAGRVVIPS